VGAMPLDDLRAELAAGQGVVIVGSGASVAATGGAPTASWVGLFNDGVAYCEALLGPSLPAGWAERRRSQLASGDLDELIGAPEHLTAASAGRPARIRLLAYREHRRLPRRHGHRSKGRATR
jgi:hypothetical protein